MLTRAVVFSVFSLALAGCRIEISVPQHGQVESESGAYRCDAGETCRIDVVDTFFDETFQARPMQGYTFAAWRTKPSSLCGGSTEPCRLATTGFPGSPLMDILESDDVFFLEPVFGQSNHWRERAATSTAGVGPAACSMGGKLYAIGLGWGADGFFLTNLGKVEVYDPLTNAWTALADMPTPRAWVTASVVKNQCYVIGGADAGGPNEPPALAAVEAYDPAEDSWRTVAPLPEPRVSAGSAAVGGKIYVMGGQTRSWWSATPVASVAIYDPQTNTWSKGADMPTPRTAMGVAAIDGLIYAAGGNNYDLGIGSSNIVERYDPAANQWSRVADLPEAREFLAAVALKGKLYAIGGMPNEDGSFANSDPASAKVFRYDPLTNQWTGRASMSNARYFPAAAALDGQLYLIGGREIRESPALNVTEEYTP